MELTKYYTDKLQKKCSDAEILILFIYGSFAKGMQKKESDIDCFLISREALSYGKILELKNTAVACQIELGLVPDVEYPIEIFSIKECWNLLNIDYFFKWAEAGFLEDESNDSLEMLRALISKHNIVKNNEIFLSLTMTALNIFNILIEKYPNEKQSIMRFFRM